MYTERMLEVAAYLREPSVADHFDMTTFARSVKDYSEAYTHVYRLDKCGTVGCIGGHTIFYFWNKGGKERMEIDRYYRECMSDTELCVEFEVARKLLGLTKEEAEILFLTWEWTQSKDNNAAADRIEKMVKNATTREDYIPAHSDAVL